MCMLESCQLTEAGLCLVCHRRRKPQLFKDFVPDFVGRLFLLRSALPKNTQSVHSLPTMAQRLPLHADSHVS